MSGIALKSLTVDFHEPGFDAKLAQENQFGPWFTLSDRERQQLGSPMGPGNPQALNRYSYVQNNPLKYTDPSGHTWYLGHAEANGLIQVLTRLKNDLNFRSAIAGGGVAAETAIAQLLGATFVGGLALGGVAFLAAISATFLAAGYELDQLITYLSEYNGEDGLALATDESSIGLYILDRHTGDAVYVQPGILFQLVMNQLPASLRMGAPAVVVDSKNPDWQNQYHWAADA